MKPFCTLTATIGTADTSNEDFQLFDEFDKVEDCWERYYCTLCPATLKVAAGILTLLVCVENRQDALQHSKQKKHLMMASRER